MRNRFSILLANIAIDISFAFSLFSNTRLSTASHVMPKCKDTVGSALQRSTIFPLKASFHYRPEYFKFFSH